MEVEGRRFCCISSTEQFFEFFKVLFHFITPLLTSFVLFLHRRSVNNRRPLNNRAFGRIGNDEQEEKTRERET